MIRFKTKQKSKEAGMEDLNDFPISQRFNPVSSSGYTLLFAMIVASVVLAIGVSLLTISRKEFILSSSATESTNSFYAADSGINCAEYWGTYSKDFSTSTYNTTTTNNSKDKVTCSSNNSVNPRQVNVLSPTSGPTYPKESGDTYTYTFSMPFSTDGTSNNMSCAYVTVDRYYAPDSSDEFYPYTTITSYGYNIGWNPSGNGGLGDCSTASPKKLERAIQVTY